MTGGADLGIDYGTSNTVAVLRRPDGRSRALLFDSSPLLPSAVFAAPDGTLLTGRDAERGMRTDPAAFEPNPKRRVDELSVLLGGREYPVTALVAATLRQVAAEAVRVAGGPVGRVSMTHPASWGPARRRVLLEAAALAGLPEPVLVPEPVAAAAYFTAVLGMRIVPGQSVVVYDLGAGTFDASVVRRTPGGFDTLAYRGLDDVGGLDLDTAVFDLVCAALDRSAAPVAARLRRPASPDDQRQRLLVWQDARAARESLTRNASATVYVAAAGQDVLVTRAEYETAAEPLLRRTIEVTLATARESRVPADGFAGWFLVGGATRTPLVATLLLRATGRTATVLEEPQLVVAEGALHCGPPPPAPAPEPVAVPGPEVAAVADVVPAERSGVPALGRSGAELAGIGLVASAAAAALVSGAIAPATGGPPADWLIAPTLGAPLAVLTYYRVGRLTRPGRRLVDAVTVLATVALCAYAAATALTAPAQTNGGVVAGRAICVVAPAVAAVIWTVRLLRR
ncbi:Hsp70 family protein [Dactylosporangium aurantiacum]|uniref:Hsp70 family protein n=1 Tax=Dactylosporangium aurantiacum TaxID=35754 RepID=A0A9Q9MF61_9ACTN|nr:Hsp70 family protein [Dactylosporangium aurantiacum]MDG6101973.1 Hsp70 family protein [Dactylosporangium aurantiacum]UWZ52240.1 Hsp70 family protein [Dactylosporangium aurantiacum]